jgi:hypothetical protein
MRYRFLSYLLALFSTVSLGACDEAAGTGEEGGACRVGRSACNGDLVCHEGACVNPSDAPADPLTEEDFVVDFALARRSLKADGLDEQIVEVRIEAAANGAKYNGEMLLRTEPLQAARLEPNRLDFKDGFSAFRMRSCNVDGQRCPASFRIVLARLEFPTESLSASPAIDYVGLPSADEDAGAGAGGEGGASASGGSTVPTPDCGPIGCWSGRYTVSAPVPALGGMPARTVSVAGTFADLQPTRSSGASAAGEGVTFSASGVRSEGTGVLKSFLATFQEESPVRFVLVGTSMTVALSAEAGAPTVDLTCRLETPNGPPPPGGVVQGSVNLSAGGASVVDGAATTRCIIDVPARNLLQSPDGMPVEGTLPVTAELTLSATN